MSYLAAGGPAESVWGIFLAVFGAFVFVFICRVLTCKLDVCLGDVWSFRSETLTTAD